jgi:FixJ family two-component response regulator
MNRDVLLLDDDDDCLDALAELIELAAGRRVRKTHSVRELQDLGEQVLECELAILDVNLGPGVPSGLDALRWLIGKNFCGRIVFLTGHAPTFPLVDEAKRTAGVRVLTKPIESEELLELLASGG